MVAIAGAYYVGVMNQPPAPPPPVKDNVIQALTKAGGFSTFLQAIQSADLTTMLSGAGPYTVFAPTDAAFAKIPASELSALLADKQRMISVISYHIVSGHFTSSELANPMINTLRSAQGSNLVIGGNKVEKATLVTKDIALATSNSVIHSIDTVLKVPLRLLTISTVGLGLKNIQPATYEMWVTEGTTQTS
ncbi:MAG: fasciclin domain-containing protein, partial [Candidatus Bathyarchaeota archaeon]|nr:fasciclin domain-containing protein [Candidatus Bathyarchaeota archaeon]